MVERVKRLCRAPAFGMRSPAGNERPPPVAAAARWVGYEVDIAGACIIHEPSSPPPPQLPQHPTCCDRSSRVSGGGVAICHVLPVLWTTSCLSTATRNMGDAYTQTDPPGAAPERSDIYESLSRQLQLLQHPMSSVVAPPGAHVSGHKRKSSPDRPATSPPARAPAARAFRRLHLIHAHDV